MNQKNRKTNEIIVRKYFNRIKLGDLHDLLELFSNDSVIHEPFSKSSRLLGKKEIEPFFKTVIMVNQALEYEINIDRQEDDQKNKVVADVILRKEHEIKARFAFVFENTKYFKLNTKIKYLLIEFID